MGHPPLLPHTDSSFAMKKAVKTKVKSAKPKAKGTATKKRPSPRRKPTVKAAALVPAKRKNRRILSADIDNLGELPRSYGETGLFVIAQEPRWLFCYWDFALTDNRQEQVFLRHARRGAAPEGETQVPREANSWYLSVQEADADYTVELGFYELGGWKRLARSTTVLTPRDTPSAMGDPVFANMPFHLTFQQLIQRLSGEMRQGESLTEALARLQNRGEMPTGYLTPAQRMALDTLLGAAFGPGVSSGDSLFSGGFGPTSREEVPGGFSSGFLALMDLVGSSRDNASWSGALGGWSSPGVSSWGLESSPLSGRQGARRGFFMHVNAEVILYGGTEPGAKVTIDGQPVALRPDGTFRQHFVFPDGQFEVPVVATSPDGLETRRAVLHFERVTGRTGEIGATGQPPLPAPTGQRR